eukprot:TRINITY_DN8447_c0_g1_i1.p1 TRINITY_DN8447_c0_g1~~TRINITY_DN8447_c0_g1_i1.p1  ORF type:complete len:343 (-),score=85.69 TRINITY_DN8447_c0_g1_i1:219-1247(-)
METRAYAHNAFLHGDKPKTKCNTERKVIRSVFERKENVQTKQHIRDLECNLSLNKKIVHELISDKVGDVQSKAVMERLNEENKALQNQLKTVVEERDVIQAKLLISEQVTVNYKMHEEELVKEALQSKAELLDQLNRKEYALQRLEQKYQKALKVMKGLVHKDPQVTPFFSELREEVNIDSKVTNVLEANNRLKTELTLERQRVQMLAEQMLEHGLDPRVSMNKHFPTVGLEWNSESGPMHKSCVSVYREGKEDVKYVMKEKPLAKLNIANTSQVEELKNKVKELYRINEKLREALQLATDRLQVSCKANRRLKTYRTMTTLLDFQVSSKEAEQGEYIIKNP